MRISPEQVEDLNSEEDYEPSDNISNFSFENHPLGLGEDDFDENFSVQNRIKLFEKTLQQKNHKSKDSFFHAILWAVYSKLKKQDNLEFDGEILEQVVGANFLKKINDLKINIRLNINLVKCT